MPFILISNVRVFDGDSVLHEVGHVLIENARIKDIFGGEKPPQLPSGTDIVDGSGCTILPGLIDAHVHVYEQVHFMENTLRAGVTTLVDLHNEPNWFQQSLEAAHTRNDVSDFKGAGYAGTIKDGWPSAIVKLTVTEPAALERMTMWPNLVDVTTAERFVADNVALGASYIKLMQEDGQLFNLDFPIRPVPTPSLEVQKAIVESAHKAGKLAIAHAMSKSAHLKMIEAGVDGLAHICTEPVSQDLLDVYKKHKPFVMPTMVVLASGSGEEQESREKFAHGLPEDEKQRMCACLKVTHDPQCVVNAANTVRELRSMGIDIVCGTDSSGHLVGTSASASVHHELWLYVNRCGMSPIEALRSATSVSARCLRMPDRGMIKQGLNADLVLVQGNPIEEIEVLRNVKAVWRNGEMLSVR